MAPAKVLPSLAAPPSKPAASVPAKSVFNIPSEDDIQMQCQTALSTAAPDIAEAAIGTNDEIDGATRAQRLLDVKSRIRSKRGDFAKRLVVKTAAKS